MTSREHEAMEKHRLPKVHDTLAARLTWAREKVDVTAQDLSYDVGLSHATCWRLEAQPGARIEGTTAFKLAAKLAPPLGVPIPLFAQWLVCGYTEPVGTPGSGRGTFPRPAKTAGGGKAHRGGKAVGLRGGETHCDRHCLVAAPGRHPGRF